MLGAFLLVSKLRLSNKSIIRIHFVDSGLECPLRSTIPISTPPSRSELPLV